MHYKGLKIIYPFSLVIIVILLINFSKKEHDKILINKDHALSKSHAHNLVICRETSMNYREGLISGMGEWSQVIHYKELHGLLYTI